MFEFGTPASPRGWSLDLPDPAVLASRCVDATVDESVVRALIPMRAPLAELLASPISARVAVLGHHAGLRFVHHELRVRPHYPGEAWPEHHPQDVGPPRPTWSEGVLTEPKYFSAHLDAPLPTFDPNHRSQWRPHELLHRLVGFYWHPTMSRFEAYLGARLGELLPVVHWYGLDEIGRRRCADHQREPPVREHCVACERISGQGEGVFDTDRGRADRFADRALEHFATEWDACRREFETGHVHATPRPGLDASSDARGYLRGHWNRLTAWSFGAWCERFGGGDWVDRLDLFAERSSVLLHRLVSGVLEAPGDITAFDRGALIRRARDTAYRALIEVERRDSDAVEDAMLIAVDRLARATVEVEGDAVDLARVELLHVAERELGLDARTALEADGWSTSPMGAAQLRRGLALALPKSAKRPEWESVPVDFDRVGRTWSTGRAAGRFAAALPDADVSPEFAACVALESWLDGVGPADQEAEDFGALPHGRVEGRLRLNTSARRGRFDASAIREVLEWVDQEGGGEVELATWRMRGEVRVMAVDAASAQWLDTVERGGPTAQALATQDAGLALIDNGLAVWLPRPSRVVPT